MVTADHMQTPALEVSSRVGARREAVMSGVKLLEL